jgi:Transglutaminase-like superfamily
MMNNTGMTAWFKYFQDASAKWRRRSRAERLLLMEAFLLLGIARLTVLVLPFKWLAVSLGRHKHEADAQISFSDLNLARKVGQAVCSAANYTPWESVCLPQAVAAKWMLKRRHVAGTLYLGVAKDETKPEKLSAHAWLRSGNIILTGAAGHRQFTVVATFS